MSAGKHALLAGASGLVGGYCLRRLLDHPSYSRVSVWSRRPLPVSHEKLSVALTDFSRIPDMRQGVDDVFCCLGTTIAKAGSREEFRRVDHDYPVALANFAKMAGARAFLMVSALGADAGSRVFYNRVKGETENTIAAFGLPVTLFFRPSILLGPRDENRPGEKLGILLGRMMSPLLIGSLARYRPIAAETVAAAMVFAATQGLASGVVESEAIATLGRRN